MASRILELAPPHKHYCESFAGGLNVLFAKDPKGVSEVVNDLDRNVANFWEVLREDHLFRRFKRLCEATPFSEKLFLTNHHALRKLKADDPADLAWWFFTTCRMSMAGRMKSFAPLSRTRTRRGMNEQASAWWTAVEGLETVYERMKPVVVLNMPAVKCIKQQDDKETFHYLDPSYLKTTRVSPEVYACEMTREQHIELLDTILTVKGKVILSGYASKLYDRKLKDWHRIEIEIPNHAASGKEKRTMTEVLWLNYDPTAQRRRGFFR